MLRATGARHITGGVGYVIHIAKLAAVAALAGAIAGCSYNAESSFLGYRSSISYSTPGAGPPPPGPPPTAYNAPPGPPAAYGPQTSCYTGGHYNRWGYWVPSRNRC